MVGTRIKRTPTALLAPSVVEVKNLWIEFLPVATAWTATTNRATNRRVPCAERATLGHTTWTVLHRVWRVLLGKFSHWGMFQVPSARFVQKEHNL